MRDTLFPRWQCTFLGIFLLAGGLYLPATPEAVQTVILGTVLAAFVCLCWLKLLSVLGERDFDGLCRNRLPKPVSLILRVCISAACIAGIAHSLWRVAGFLQETSFPGIPLWVCGAVPLFLGWSAGRRGRTAVAMWCYPLFCFIGVIVIASLAITIPDCNPEHLTELIENVSISPRILLQFLWLGLPLLLCTQTDKLPSTRACCVGALMGGGGLALIALRAWLVLGSGGVKLPYPAFSAAGVFSVGDFLQRGEVVFGCALTLGEAARIAMLCCLLLWCLRYGRKDQSANA